METARKNKVPEQRTMRVFFHAYEQHKAQHGSFANHPEYNDAMKGDINICTIKLLRMWIVK